MTEQVVSGTLFCTGALADLSAATLRAILDRSGEPTSSAAAVTARIIDRVRRGGDSALFELARELDGVQLEALEVPRKACTDALAKIPRELRSALERSAANIASVSIASLPRQWEMSPEKGIVVGRRPDPLDIVGVYAPGGTAAYPSSVLMSAIPARIAGVGKTILASPPGLRGLPHENVLAAAALCGVEQVFAIGGAGAIAAFAFGTESVPRVNKIFGPGNAFVAAAKLQVSCLTAIDSPAGPSEIMVIADDSADPEIVAAELIAQAEHDVNASAIALLVSPMSVECVTSAIARRLQNEPRAEIVAGALQTRGAVLTCSSIEDAITFANRYAPEHLMLAVADAPDALAQIRNAGTVCLGSSSSVVFGDYITGANHVLPTAGMARSFSGLSVLDFIRWTSYQSVTRAAARRISRATGIFAASEGLPAHASAARLYGDA